MKILFFGTAQFAVPVLQTLLKTNHEISGVVTQHDHPQGRGQKLVPSPVKAIAQGRGLHIYQPEKLKCPEFLNRVKEIKPDIFIVVSYGNVLPADLLMVPKLYPVNIHASLLPKYRGASPVQSVLINGEERTGVTVIRMNDKLDAGDIMLKEEVQIQKEDDAVTLSDNLSNLAAGLTPKTLTLIEKGLVTFTPQDEKNATYCLKLHKDNGLIDWKKNAKEISNQVRGMLPWPGTFTYWNGKLLKVWKVRVITDEGVNFHPGRVESVGKDGIIVNAGCGKVLLSGLQLAGGRRLPAADFMSGHNLTPGTILG